MGNKFDNPPIKVKLNSTKLPWVLHKPKKDLRVNKNPDLKSETMERSKLRCFCPIAPNPQKDREPAEETKVK